MRRSTTVGWFSRHPTRRSRPLEADADRRVSRVRPRGVDGAVRRHRALNTGDHGPRRDRGRVGARAGRPEARRPARLGLSRVRRSWSSRHGERVERARTRQDHGGDRPTRRCAAAALGATREDRARAVQLRERDGTSPRCAPTAALRREHDSAPIRRWRDDLAAHPTAGPEAGGRHRDHHRVHHRSRRRDPRCSRLPRPDRAGQPCDATTPSSSPSPREASRSTRSPSPP